MGVLTIFHHVGTVFLLAASILLLITTITAPVVNSLSMLTLSVPGRGYVTYGTFGYCIIGLNDNQFTAGDFFTGSGRGCSGRSVGYDAVTPVEELDQADYGSAARDTANGLTRVQVLHPIVCGLAFISFLFAAGAGLCGSLFAFALAFITWVLTLVVMATDFTAFGIIRNHVNDDASATYAYFGTGMWTELAAMVLLFFGMFIVLFSCCANRRSKRAERMSKADAYAAPPATTTRRRFWQRRARY